MNAMGFEDFEWMPADEIKKIAKKRKKKAKKKAKKRKGKRK